MTAMNELGRLSSALEAAPDERIRRAVAVVDTLAIRGAADELIAPLRPRLARIRPPRTLNFSRLLFMPLDPAIVATSLWENGSAGVPRTALAVFARMLRQEWPNVDAIEGRLLATPPDDINEVLALGAGVWPRAAARLVGNGPPVDWQATTGLTVDQHTMVARAVATVLSHSSAILRLGGHDPEAPDLDLHLSAVCRLAFADAADLAAAHPDVPPNPAPLATLVAVMMLRLPRPDRVLAMAEAAGRGEKQSLISTQLALEVVLQGMLRDVAGGALSLATEAMQRAIPTLAQLEDLLAFRPSPRERLRELRGVLDQACRGRIKASLSRVIGPAGRIPLSSMERETLADDVRAFVQVARRLGEPGPYDAIMVDAVLQLSEPGSCGLGRAERARLVELLTEPRR